MEDTVAALELDLSKAADYLKELQAIYDGCQAEGLDEQEYVNKHPEALQIVGGNDQTELVWLKDETDIGTALVLTDNGKESIEDITYPQAKERFADAKVLKWVPDWAFLAWELFESNHPCSCCKCSEGGCGENCGGGCEGH